MIWLKKNIIASKLCRNITWSGMTWDYSLVEQKVTNHCPVIKFEHCWEFENHFLDNLYWSPHLAIWRGMIWWNKQRECSHIKISEIKYHNPKSVQLRYMSILWWCAVTGLNTIRINFERLIVNIKRILNPFSPWATWTFWKYPIRHFQFVRVSLLAWFCNLERSWSISSCKPVVK